MESLGQLDESRLKAGSAGRRWVGRQIRVLPETGSTNDVCHTLAEQGDRDGWAVFADHQVAGRGQYGRSWSAPPGSALLFSVLLEPPAPLAGPGFLTAWSAAAIAEVMAEQCGLECQIKWPNDLLVRGRKICGILVERRQATVVGVGLNVALRAADFPAELRLPATSLLIELGRLVDRTGLAAELLATLDDLFELAVRRGPEPVWERWLAHSRWLIGQQVSVVTRLTTVTGRLLDLHPATGARIARPDGTTARIAAEELLRVELS